MDRRKKFLWMREILDHLVDCCDQWQEEDVERNNSILAAAVQRDLDEVRRVCQMLVREGQRERFTTVAAA